MTAPGDAKDIRAGGAKRRRDARRRPHDRANFRDRAEAAT